MSFFSRSQKKIVESSPSPLGFEPEEKPTPFLGKVLLVVLTIVLLFFGWRGLEDLGDIPKEPEQLSQCFVRVGPKFISRGAVRHMSVNDVESFPTYYFSSNYPQPCIFSSFETEAGVPELFSRARAAYADTETAQRKVDNLQSQISNLRFQYDTSLREKVAKEPPLSQAPPQIRSQILALEAKLKSAEIEFQRMESEFRSQYLLRLIEAYQKAGDAYEHVWAGYKFKVFLLEIFFTIPFFVGSMWFYRRLHGKASPHTVIAIPLVVVASILFARVILVYFWALFLADLIEFLWRTIFQLPIFRTLLYYLGMILAFGIFGGAVYFLQRSIFAPHRVRARRIRHNRCPSCEASLDVSKTFCPMCGSQIFTPCSHCGQQRYRDMRYCPWCGKD
ncbi:MAG: hypothetical protein AAB567_03495 [Patescibacteria group bacterium]|mgnify:CR=1 FL=1